MPQKGQKTITLSCIKLLERIESICKNEDRSMAQVCKLLLEESFGTKEESKHATQILTQIREKYS